jgi:lantibiotic modifying enzyme
VLDEPEIREEIRVALDATRSHPLTALDHLCCGNLGRAEILLHASRALARPALGDEALDIAGRVLRRAAASGGSFGCAPHAEPGLADPSFFRGDSGIGFTLLRLADPGGLPCTLLLEGPPGTRSAEISGQGPEDGAGAGHPVLH